MADVPQQVGFYERMLPERERPIEALGGLLNGLGAGFGILALIWWPLFLGATGIGLAIISLVFARERGDPEPLRGRLHDRRARLADRHDDRRSRSPAAQSLMAVG